MQSECRKVSYSWNPNRRAAIQHVYEGTALKDEISRRQKFVEVSRKGVCLASLPRQNRDNCSADALIFKHHQKGAKWEHEPFDGLGGLSELEDEVIGSWRDMPRSRNVFGRR